MFATIIRTAILYITVTVAIRIMGKRQIGDMQPNELVITLLISEIAAIPLQDSNQPVINGIAAISVLVVLEIFVSAAVMKSRILRRLMNGNAVIIIKNGQIDIKAMKKVRMTLIDLTELLRAKDIFKIEDVAFAVLEVNGEISVMLKSEAAVPCAKDLSVKTEPAALALPVITDGKRVKESLEALNIKENVINNYIKDKNLKATDIFLMTADTNGRCRIIKREETR